MLNLIKKSSAFVDNHRILTIILMSFLVFINVGIAISNQSNTVAGISFGVCLIGLFNLILSKTGHIFLSSDTLWRKLKAKGQEDQYEAKCLKTAKILILIGLPLSILAIAIEIFLAINP